MLFINSFSLNILNTFFIYKTLNLYIYIIYCNFKSLITSDFKDKRYLIYFFTPHYSYTFLNKFDSTYYNICFYKKHYLNFFWSNITRCFLYFWFKLTFKGKGFRIRKFLKSKKLVFNFGRSHWTKLVLNKNFFKVFKIRRQNYIFISIYREHYFSLKKTLKFVKLINHYTKRGLRIKKQKINKRFGKISQMISSLHF